MMLLFPDKGTSLKRLSILRQAVMGKSKVGQWGAV